MSDGKQKSPVELSDQDMDMVVGGFSLSGTIKTVSHAVSMSSSAASEVLEKTVQTTEEGIQGVLPVNNAPK